MERHKEENEIVDRSLDIFRYFQEALNFVRMVGNDDQYPLSFSRAFYLVGMALVTPEKSGNHHFCELRRFQ